jgi:hypothetical protein
MRSKEGYFGCPSRHDIWRTATGISMTVPARTLLALLAIGQSLAAAPAHAAQCREETDTFQGALRLVRTRHAMNSTPIEALQLVFKPSLCVMYTESVNQKDKQRLDNVKTMHLIVTGSETAQLKRHIGAVVTAKAGKDGGISPALTAWHIGGAIMIHPEILTVGGKPFRD